MKTKYKYAKVMIPVGNVDLNQLYKHKAELVDIINNGTASGFKKKEEDALQGILNWIDTVQDAMVDAGIPEKVVFPKLK